MRSDDPVPPLDPRYPDPEYWARKPRVILTSEGHHRFLWDLRYPAVPGMSTGPSADEAVPHDTPAVASSPFVLPGDYTARITAGGKTQSEPFRIVMDPRVKTPMPELEAQFKLSKAIYDDALRATTALHEITVLREQLRANPGAPAASGADSIESKLTKIAGGEAGRGGRGGVRWRWWTGRSGRPCQPDDTAFAARAHGAHRAVRGPALLQPRRSRPTRP